MLNGIQKDGVLSSIALGVIIATIGLCAAAHEHRAAAKASMQAEALWLSLQVAQSTGSAAYEKMELADYRLAAYHCGAHGEAKTPACTRYRDAIFALENNVEEYRREGDVATAKLKAFMAKTCGKGGGLVYGDSEKGHVRCWPGSRDLETFSLDDYTVEVSFPDGGGQLIVPDAGAE